VLHNAVCNGHFDLAVLLAKAGADINAANKVGRLSLQGLLRAFLLFSLATRSLVTSLLWRLDPARCCSEVRVCHSSRDIVFHFVRSLSTEFRLELGRREKLNLLLGLRPSTSEKPNEVCLRGSVLIANLMTHRVDFMRSPRCSSRPATLCLRATCSASCLSFLATAQWFRRVWAAHAACRDAPLWRLTPLALPAWLELALALLRHRVVVELLLLRRRALRRPRRTTEAGTRTLTMMLQRLRRRRSTCVSSCGDREFGNRHGKHLYVCNISTKACHRERSARSTAFCCCRDKSSQRNVVDK
jgi:hypothetical protein